MLFRMYLSLLLLVQFCPLSLMLTTPLRSHSTSFKSTLKSGELSESNATFTSIGWKVLVSSACRVKIIMTRIHVVAAILQSTQPRSLMLYTHVLVLLSMVLVGSCAQSESRCRKTKSKGPIFAPRTL